MRCDIIEAVPSASRIATSVTTVLESFGRGLPFPQHRRRRWAIWGSGKHGDHLIEETPLWLRPARPPAAGNSPTCLRSNT